MVKCTECAHGDHVTDGKGKVFAEVICFNEKSPRFNKISWGETCELSEKRPVVA